MHAFPADNYLADEGNPHFSLYFSLPSYAVITQKSTNMPHEHWHAP